MQRKATDKKFTSDLFCDLIQQAITAGHTKATTQFHHSLVTANAALILIHQNEVAERSKNPYQILDKDDQEIESIEAKISLLTEQMDKEEKDHNDQIRAFEDTKNNLTDKIAELKSVAISELEKETKQLAVLRADRDVAQGEYNIANRQLHQACCSFFPCCVRKEVLAENEAELRLNGINDKISTIQMDGAKSKTDISTANLYDQINKITAAIRQRNEQHQVTEKNIREQQTLAKSELAKIHGDIDAKEERYYSAQKNDLMMHYLRTYINFIEFKQEIDNEESKEYENKEGKLDPKSPLKQLHDKLQPINIQLNEILGKLWCPNSDDKNGLYFLTAQEQMPAHDQQDFKEGKRFAELVKQIIPERPGRQLAILKGEHIKQHKFMMHAPPANPITIPLAIPPADQQRNVVLHS